MTEAKENPETTPEQKSFKDKTAAEKLRFILMIVGIIAGLFGIVQAFLVEFGWRFWACYGVGALAIITSAPSIFLLEKAKENLSKLQARAGIGIVGVSSILTIFGILDSTGNDTFWKTTAVISIFAASLMFINLTAKMHVRWSNKTLAKLPLMQWLNIVLSLGLGAVYSYILIYEPEATKLSVQILASITAFAAANVIDMWLYHGRSSESASTLKGFLLGSFEIGMLVLFIVIMGLIWGDYKGEIKYRALGMSVLSFFSILFGAVTLGQAIQPRDENQPKAPKNGWLQVLGISSFVIVTLASITTFCMIWDFDFFGLAGDGDWLFTIYTMSFSCTLTCYMLYAKFEEQPFWRHVSQKVLYVTTPVLNLGIGILMVILQLADARFGWGLTFFMTVLFILMFVNTLIVNNYRVRKKNKKKGTANSKADEEDALPQ